MKRAISLLSSLLIRKEDDLELVLRPRVYKRTTEQNRRYWMLMDEISERVDVKGVFYPSKVWHIYFRERFIGCEDWTLPNGKVVSEPISTTTLDKAAFSEYMTRLEVWAAEHGVLLAEAA